MPGKTILEIPVAEQEQMLRELRAARYGYLLALHILFSHCTFCCCVLRGERRPRLPSFSFVRAPASIAWSRLTGVGSDGWLISPPPAARRCLGCRVSSGRWCPSSSVRRRRSDGVAPDGVAPRWRWSCTRGAKLKSRAKASDAGCTRSVMCGSGRGM